MEPSRNSGEAVNQNLPTFLPTPINKIDTNLEIIKQVLALSIPKRNRHAHKLEVVTGVLKRVEELLRGESSFPAGGVDISDVEFTDLLDGDGEAGAPFGEEGDGGGAEDGEDVGDVVVVDGAGLENLRRVADVSDEEILTDEVRHHRNIRLEIRFWGN